MATCSSLNSSGLGGKRFLDARVKLPLRINSIRRIVGQGGRGVKSLWKRNRKRGGKFASIPVVWKSKGENVGLQGGKSWNSKLIGKKLV